MATNPCSRDKQIQDVLMVNHSGSPGTSSGVAVVFDPDGEQDAATLKPLRS